MSKNTRKKTLSTLESRLHRTRHPVHNIASTPSRQQCNAGRQGPASIQHYTHMQNSVSVLKSLANSEVSRYFKQATWKVNVLAGKSSRGFQQHETSFFDHSHRGAKEYPHKMRREHLKDGEIRCWSGIAPQSQGQRGRETRKHTDPIQLHPDSCECSEEPPCGRKNLPIHHRSNAQTPRHYQSRAVAPATENRMAQPVSVSGHGVMITEMAVQGGGGRTSSSRHMR